MKKFTRFGTTNSSGGLFSFRNTTTLFKSSGTFKRPSLFMIIVKDALADYVMGGVDFNAG